MGSHSSCSEEADNLLHTKKILSIFCLAHTQEESLTILLFYVAYCCSHKLVFSIEIAEVIG